MKKILITILMVLSITPVLYLKANINDFDNAFTVELPFTYDANDILINLNALDYLTETEQIEIDFYIENNTGTTIIIKMANNDTVYQNGLNWSDNYSDDGVTLQSYGGISDNQTEIIENESYLVIIYGTGEVIDTIPLNFEEEPPTLIETLFGWLSSIVTGFLGIMITLFSNNGVTGIIYNETNGLTIVGTLLLLMFGIYIVRWAFSFISRLIQMRR